MSRPSSLEETLILGKIVDRGRQMRIWDGITYSKDMSLRKLHEIVKDREACFVAKHVITKSQTWLSNWTIPMRRQGPVKALVLVGVEKDLVGRGGFPSSGAGPWIQTRSTRFWMCYQKLFSKKTKNCFLQESELWLSLFSRFYWRMSKRSGVGWVCKNQVTGFWSVRLVVDIWH